MINYRRVLDKAINLKSTNSGFKITNFLVGTYQQTKKRTQLVLPKKFPMMESGLNHRTCKSNE